MFILESYCLLRILVSKVPFPSQGFLSNFFILMLIIQNFFTICWFIFHALFVFFLSLFNTILLYSLFVANFLVLLNSTGIDLFLLHTLNIRNQVFFIVFIAQFYINVHEVVVNILWEASLNKKEFRGYILIPFTKLCWQVRFFTSTYSLKRNDSIGIQRFIFYYLFIFFPNGVSYNILSLLNYWFENLFSFLFGTGFRLV